MREVFFTLNFPAGSVMERVMGFLKTVTKIWCFSDTQGKISYTAKVSKISYKVTSQSCIQAGVPIFSLREL
jgi:hypothetical protein